MLERDGAAGRSLGHRPPDDEAPHGRRLVGERRGVEPPDEAVAPTRRARRLGGHGVHPAPLVARQRRCVGEHVHDARVEPRLEQRHELGAHAVARDGDVAVRFVLDVRRAARVEIRAQRVAAAVEQRPDDRAAPRRHRREAARAGAAKEPQQERLGLIVARVPERDDVGAEPATRARSKNAWRAARAAASIDRRSRRARAATSSRSTSAGQPNDAASATATRSSASRRVREADG